MLFFRLDYLVRCTNNASHLNNLLLGKETKKCFRIVMFAEPIHSTQPVRHRFCATSATSRAPRMMLCARIIARTIQKPRPTLSRSPARRIPASTAKTSF